MLQSILVAEYNGIHPVWKDYVDAKLRLGMEPSKVLSQISVAEIYTRFKEFAPGLSLIQNRKSSLKSSGVLEINSYKLLRDYYLQYGYCDKNSFNSKLDAAVICVDWFDTCEYSTAHTSHN